MRHFSEIGFTLIELITAITIMAILSTVGIAAFVNYSRTQDLASSTQNVVSMLQLAKASATSQVKPAGCTPGTLDGYQVVINPTLKTYSVAPVCGGQEDLTDKKTETLPANITFSGNTTQTFLFHTISGDVVISPANTVVTISYVNINSLTKSIRVWTDARIQVQ